MRVEYVRDGLVEEFHDGICVGLNDNDTEPYFLRSCAKPLQASLIIDCDIDFTDEELALCCGSHAGEECHVRVANGILNKLGLDESYLKCGIHEPLAGLKEGETATAIHNNCSGKHLGFLAVCKAQGWDLDTYYEPEHPLQVAVKKRIYELCEINAFHASPLVGEAGRSPDEGGYPMTTDGCGVPIVSMPLHNLVKGFKNLNQQYPQLVNAILKNPYIYGGINRLDTEIIQKTGMLAKVGAGGLCVVLDTKLNDGFAVKMYDASMNARRIAVLDKLGVEYDNKIRTLSGKIVGEIRVLEKTML